MTTLSRAAAAAIPGLFVLAVVAAPCSGDDTGYHWPLADKTCMTSSFGEYRSRHFHGGIDFSTGGEEGRPVLAIADGEVWRVVSGVRGFGRAVYLRLDDGRFALYAHLSRFNPELERYVLDRQLGEKTYVQDMYPSSGQFRVHRGDVVAWSGQSGAGPPHLHFELRADESDPVNPLDEFEVPDRGVPVPRAIAVEPLDRGGRVDGRTALVAMPVRWSPHDHAYVMTGTPRVHGRIGFSIAAIDGVPGCDARLAPYRLDLSVDGTRIFRGSIDRVSYVTAPEADVIFRAGPPGRGAERFFRLHRVKELPPSTFGTLEGDGAITVISGIVVMPSSEVLMPSAPRLSGDMQELLGPDESAAGGAAGSSGGLDTGAFLVAPGEHRIAVLVRDHAGNEARVIGRFVAEGLSRTNPGPPGEASPASRRRTAAAERRTPAQTLEIAWRRGFLEVEATIPSGLEAPPSVRIESGAPGTTSRAGAVMEPLGDAHWLACLDPLKHGDGERVVLEARDARGRPIHAERPIEPAWLVHRGEAFDLPVGGHAGAIRFAKNSLYFDTVFRIRRVAAEGDASAGLDPVGEAWLVDATDLVVNAFPWVGFRAPDSLRTDPRVALYRREADLSAWQYVGRDTNPALPGAIGGSDRPTGTLALLRDREPPLITGLALFPVTGAGGAATTGRVECRATIRDNGSGLDPEGITLLVDGAWVPAEWDPERDLLLYPLPREGRPPKVELTVTDRAGNRSRAALP